MVGAFSKFATEELTAFGVYSQPDFREDGGHKRREVTRVCCATNYDQAVALSKRRVVYRAIWILSMVQHRHIRRYMLWRQL